MRTAGLILTLGLAWSISATLPMIARMTRLRPVVALAIALCALAWSAALGLGLRLVMRQPRRMLGITVWFAPATLLFLWFTPIGMITGILVAVIAARLLCAEWQSRAAPAPLLARIFVPALVVAAGFQAAAAAIPMAHLFLSATLAVACAAMLTAMTFARGAWMLRGSPKRWRSVATLSFVALLGWMFGGSALGPAGPGAESAQGAALKGVRTGAADDASKANPELSLPGSFPGVILWPESPPATTLVAPPLPATGRSAVAVFSKPLTIPFGGVYWMYRWPFLNPPSSSFFRRGKPTSLFFATVDRAALEMEARQKLAQPVSIYCCSRLRVEILNADPSPRTISLEVILINGEGPGAAIERLGTALLTSAPTVTGEQAIAQPETLEFRFPMAPRMHAFDQIKVVFHRAIARKHKSARVAIERFILEPR